jgi:hypothetical protein
MILAFLVFSPTDIRSQSVLTSYETGVLLLMDGPRGSPLQIVNGWKEIARHLRTSVRSAQRYEQIAGLPVRRPLHGIRGAVIATTAELDAWINARPLKDAFTLRPVLHQNYVVAMETFRTYLAEHRRLRQELTRGRDELHAVVELVRASLAVVQDESATELERRLTGVPLPAEKRRIM